MTNEEFQKLILEKLVSIEKGQRNLEKVQLEISDRVIALEGNINAIQEQTITLSEFREETKENFSVLSNRVDGIENKLDDIESNNANMHLDLGSSMNALREDLNAIEIVTSKNWNDIAKLKTVR